MGSWRGRGRTLRIRHAPRSIRGISLWKAKVEFKADVAKRKAEKANAGKPTVPATPAAPAPAPAAALTMPTTPQVMTVDVNGQAYHVTVAFGDTNSSTPEVKPTVAPPDSPRGNKRSRRRWERGAFSAGR